MSLQVTQSCITRQNPDDFPQHAVQTLLCREGLPSYTVMPFILCNKVMHLKAISSLIVTPVIMLTIAQHRPAWGIPAWVSCIVLLMLMHEHANGLLKP